MKWAAILVAALAAVGTFHACVGPEARPAALGNVTNTPLDGHVPSLTNNPGILR
ncbi:MAG: hypothetical protein KJ579_02655 [Verrucomicrobia bacterium]|nr:hypothetical protein [Verrucomicrobiota bacterium]